MPNSAKSSRLPVLVIVLMTMQPLLDIVSYFWSGTGKSNLLTLALRMGLLAAAGLYAFCISDRKRVYLIAAGICVFILAMIICLALGQPMLYAMSLGLVIFILLGRSMGYSLITLVKMSLRKCAQALIVWRIFFYMPV